METPALQNALRTQLVLLGGNPQLNKVVHGKQLCAETPALSSSSFRHQHNVNRDRGRIPRKDCISWLNNGVFVTNGSPANGPDNDEFDNGSTTSSMEAQASCAATEADEDKPLSDEPDTAAVGRIKGAIDHRTDLAFLGEWDSDNEHNIPDVIRINDLDVDEPIPVASHEGDRWQELAHKQDDPGWHRGILISSPTLAYSEPTLTDGSTVESESVFSHEHPIDEAASDGYRPPPPESTTTVDPDTSGDTDKEVLSTFNELPFASFSEYEQTCRGGSRRGSVNRGRGGRGRQGRGGHGQGASSSSNDLTPYTGSSISSSARASNELKRGPGDDDDDHDADDNDKDEPRQSKRPRRAASEKEPLACPFFKRYPVESIDCMQYEIKTTAYLRQHFKRYHYQPIHCVICGREFPKKTELDEHLIQKNCEGSGVVINKLLMNEDTQKEIEGYSGRNVNEHSRWFRFWSILFPGVPHPSSPFQTGTWPTVCGMVESQLHQSYPSIISSFKENGYLSPEDQAHANFRVMVRWVRDLPSMDVERTRHDGDLSKTVAFEQASGSNDATNSGGKGKLPQDTSAGIEGENDKQPEDVVVETTIQSHDDIPDIPLEMEQLGLLSCLWDDPTAALLEHHSSDTDPRVFNDNDADFFATFRCLEEE